MKDHMHIHFIDGTCEICGEVNSRVRASWKLSHPTQPTQDTESWETEFDEKFLIRPQSEFSVVAHQLHLKDFINQKKQWWTDEGYIRGYKQGKGDRAELIKEARTQGAEAAVALIDKEFRQYIEAYCFDKEIDDVFEKAKKV